jgi:hypothetical protein
MRKRGLDVNDAVTAVRTDAPIPTETAASGEKATA